MELVGEILGVAVEEIEGPSRTRRLVDARQLVARALRVRGATLRDIGEVLGGRDHSTVVNLLKRRLPAYLEMHYLHSALFQPKAESN
jgi:chromosomal replication initiation ATPase DnaA